MADLAERLKKLGTDSVGNYGMPIAKEAANEIDTLRVRVKKLEEKLKVAEEALVSASENKGGGYAIWGPLVSTALAKIKESS